MGLFGGGSSSSSTSNTQNITTNTTSTVRDIGLTGQNAVDLAKTVTDAGIVNNQLTASVLSNIATEQKNSFDIFAGNTKDVLNNTLAFANNIIQTSFSDLNAARKSNENLTNTSLDNSAKQISSAQALASGSIQSAFSLTGANTSGFQDSLTKYGTYLMIAAAAFFLMKGKL